MCSQLADLGATDLVALAYPLVVIGLSVLTHRDVEEPGQRLLRTGLRFVALARTAAAFQPQSHKSRCGESFKTRCL